MKRCLMIVNPSSGQRTIQKNLDKLIGQLVIQEVINHIDIFYTQKKDDAYNKAKEANESDYDFIICIGGDGTLNETISGMVDSNKKIPLAIIAAGTVNDFAHYLELPTTNQGIIDLIKEFNVISSDVGKINDRYFINVAAGGMFSDVSFAVSKADKKKFGPLAYYVNGLVNLPSQLKTNINLTIKTNNQEFDIDAYMFVVTNTNRVGGFDNIIPFADIKDGLLDLIVVKRCSITDLIALFKDYRFSKHENSPFIEYIQSKEFEITCNNQDLFIDIDGEKGDPLPVNVKIINNAINLLVPSSKA